MWFVNMLFSPWLLLMCACVPTSVPVNTSMCESIQVKVNFNHPSLYRTSRVEFERESRERGREGRRQQSPGVSADFSPQHLFFYDSFGEQ